MVLFLKHSRSLKLSKTFQPIIFDHRRTNGLYGCMGNFVEVLRAVCTYNQWDYKGTVLNGGERQNHREIPPGGGLRLNSTYICGDYLRTPL